MALTERQNEILKVLREKKSAGVAALAQDLYVSEATIRRDLAEMKSMGLIERSHGGALLPEDADEISIFFRMEKNAEEKERAATKALPHIPSFKSVFVDSSSTALALAVYTIVWFDQSIGQLGHVITTGIVALMLIGTTIYTLTRKDEEVVQDE